MSFGITVERAIKDARVTFTATLDTAKDALTTATLLATGDAPAATAKSDTASTEKKAQTADTSAKASEGKQTQTASGNSGSSLSESTKASDAGAGTAEQAPTLDYTKDIKPLVLEIAKISRAKAEGLLQRFGVASAKDLKADQFADFKVKAEQVIAGTYDPVASDEEAIA
ncbi:hypothetical protein [Achromobacter xylosoxidans]|uniref:hypothetical protein n=1 Tax=Alcaligenes xylosoxydans xylosoxydans TaxID=85698 RepID=UPI000B4915BE|nr:hypothetical protein [Achromobacter xylosoxidans]